MIASGQLCDPYEWQSNLSCLIEQNAAGFPWPGTLFVRSIINGGIYACVLYIYYTDVPYATTHVLKTPF